jgi:hypothetical protein
MLASTTVAQASYKRRYISIEPLRTFIYTRPRNTIGLLNGAPLPAACTHTLFGEIANIPYERLGIRGDYSILFDRNLVHKNSIGHLLAVPGPPYLLHPPYISRWLPWGLTRSPKSSLADTRQGRRWALEATRW